MLIPVHQDARVIRPFRAIPGAALAQPALLEKRVALPRARVDQLLLVAVIPLSPAIIPAATITVSLPPAMVAFGPARRVPVGRVRFVDNRLARGDRVERPPAGEKIGPILRPVITMHDNDRAQPGQAVIKHLPHMPLQAVMTAASNQDPGGCHGLRLATRVRNA
jgi:hypothetical protein